MSIPDTVPRYRALAPTFLTQYRHAAAAVVPAGTEVLFEGEFPGSDLLPLNPAAVAAKARSIRLRGRLVMAANNQGDMARLVRSLGLPNPASWEDGQAAVDDWRAVNAPKCPSNRR